jgi:glycosyltransferase involved in cell wall biosynthesis
LASYIVTLSIFQTAFTNKSSSKMSRIAHLSSAHSDGDVRIFHKECSSLAAEGFEVHLILSGVEERSENGVTIHSVPKYPNHRFKRMWTTVNDVYLKALEINADVYHLHDPELLRIALKLKRKGKIVIYDAHEDLPRQILGKPYLKFKNLISFLAERYENYVVRRINGVIAATPFIRDRFITIQPTTTDINNFPILEEFQAIKRENVSPNSVCYVGGITRVRGIIELLDALSFCEFELFIAGPFESETLEQNCKNHLNWSKVNYLGILNREEVAKLYGKTAIGIVTLHPIINYLDSLPIKMFEYMYTGLATIASDFPLWKTIVVDNECGICINPLQPKEIAGAIAKLIQQPELAQKMGENGRKLALKKYNWDQEKIKLIKFYEQIICA